MKKVKKWFELRMWRREGKGNLPSSEWSVCSGASWEEHRSSFTAFAKDSGVQEGDTLVCLELFSFFFACFCFVFLEIVKDVELSGPFRHEGEAVWGDYFPSLQMSPCPSRGSLQWRSATAGGGIAERGRALSLGCYCFFPIRCPLTPADCHSWSWVACRIMEGSCGLCCKCVIREERKKGNRKLIGNAWECTGLKLASGDRCCSALFLMNVSVATAQQVSADWKSLMAYLSLAGSSSVCSL